LLTDQDAEARAENLDTLHEDAPQHLGQVLPVGRWVLRIGVFLLPLAFLPNIVDEFVLPKLLLVRLLVIILGILLLLGWSMQGAITWKRTPLDWPLLAFIASAALSSLFAVNQLVAVFGTYDRWEGLVTIATYALLFWLAVQFMSGERDARGLTWSLLISGYVVAVVAVLQSAFGLFGAGYFTVPGGGPIRADVTLANPDFLGIFLAMLLPIAVAKLISQRPLLTRVLSANLLVVLTLALLLTYARAAWIGAFIGVLVVLSLRRGRFHIWPSLVLGAGLLVGLALLGAAGAAQSGNQTNVAGSIYARVISVANFSAGTESGRLQIWHDTLPLIAGRPVLGYGPDNFGLVFPPFATSNQQGVLWDKPHEELLGTVATQGIVGALAYAWIIVAFVVAFWAGRRRRGAVALFGGWVAYEAALQVNFSYLPTSAPFWLFAAAAIVTWNPHVPPMRVLALPRTLAIPAVAVGSLLLAALAIPALVLPYLADADYYSSQAATDLQQARSLIAQARTLAPFEATYASQAGDFALDLDSSGNPSSNADWAGALEAYSAASRLGSYTPETFQHLAITEEHLGDHVAAIAAARRALELDPYDPTSKALLTKLTS
jgi:O-antigen ligase